MNYILARCVALLAGNGAVLLFMSQHIMDTAWTVQTRRDLGLLMAFPLIGVAAAYSALYWHEKSSKVGTWYEWLSVANFLAMAVIWVVVNATV